MNLIKETVLMSLKNIKNNKLRSFLTTLGIIIGVTAVIALITIVHGVYDSVMGQFSDLGANKITVSISGNTLKSGVTDADIENIEALSHVEGVSPSVNTSVTVKQNYESETARIQGKGAVYFKNNGDIVSGRALTDLEMEGDVYTCIIDRDCAQKYFLGQNPIGQTLNIGGYTYTIVGLEDGGSDISTSMTKASDGGTITIPYKNAMKLSGTGYITSLEVYISDTAYSEQVTTAIENVLKESFHNDEDSYTVTNMDSLIETMESTENMLMAMLGGIASISLLVGGIGIMNMMLVSVSERTREIGLRKALGAKPQTIQLQFLLESIVLSLAGGLIGVVLGLAISYVAAVFIDITFEIQFYSIILGVGFSAGIGIIFGWMPARRASQLNPIDALRSE